VGEHLEGIGGGNDVEMRLVGRLLDGAERPRQDGVQERIPALLERRQRRQLADRRGGSDLLG
jgi:hypothetical protein